jgi:hypothetical protein
VSKTMPSHHRRYNSSSPGIPVSQMELQLSFHLDALVAGQWEAEGACTEGEVEDRKVDLMLLMGREDDFGEIHNGLAPREPSKANAESTGDPSRVLSTRISVFRSEKCEEEGEAKQAFDGTGRLAQEAFDGTGRFWRPLLRSLRHRSFMIQWVGRKRLMLVGLVGL